jgi:hypothetical protein
MKAYLLFTDTGPIVILTSYDSIRDPGLVSKLEAKSIKKFVAYELPLSLVKERYEAHFDMVRNNPEETDELRILEYDGERAFNMFSFDELGPAIYHEPKK